MGEVVEKDIDPEVDTATPEEKHQRMQARWWYRIISPDVEVSLLFKEFEKLSVCCNKQTLMRSSANQTELGSETLERKNPKQTKEGGSMIRRFVAWSRRRRGRMRLRSLLVQLQLHLQQLPSTLPQLHQRYLCSTQPQLHQRQFTLQHQEVVNRALDWFIPQISSNRVLVTSLPHNNRRDHVGERLHKRAMCRVNKKGQIPKAKAPLSASRRAPCSSNAQRPRRSFKWFVDGNVGSNPEAESGAWGSGSKGRDQES